MIFNWLSMNWSLLVHVMLCSSLSGKVIVIHLTPGNKFPWNINTKEENFRHEKYRLQNVNHIIQSESIQPNIQTSHCRVPTQTLSTIRRGLAFIISIYPRGRYVAFNWQYFCKKYSVDVYYHIAHIRSIQSTELLLWITSFT